MSIVDPALPIKKIEDMTSAEYQAARQVAMAEVAAREAGPLADEAERLKAIILDSWTDDDDTKAQRIKAIRALRDLLYDDFGLIVGCLRLASQGWQAGQQRPDPQASVPCAEGPSPEIVAWRVKNDDGWFITQDMDCADNCRMEGHEVEPLVVPGR